LDQLTDASESGQKVVALQQEGLTFLADVDDLSPELIDLQCRRGETALKLVQTFYSFLPDVEELPAFLDPTGHADLVDVLRGHTALDTLAVPPTLRPGGEHHPEYSRH
jgi:hypothetical protein